MRGRRILLLLILVGGLLGEATSATPSETLTATIRSIDGDAGILDLITGRGHALRIVRVTILPADKIPLQDLKPGTIVRVRFRKMGDRNLAQSLEVQPQGGGR